jgi:hypothetical protein
MTAFKAPAMRRRICVSCQNKFIPKRTDAITCSSRCRMAESRKRSAKAAAEALFKTREQIARNTEQQTWALRHYRYWALHGNLDADRVRQKHIRFMATTLGMLAVQGLGKSELPLPDRVPWGCHHRGWQELKHDPSSPEAGDLKVIDAVVEALKVETIGRSFIQREYERECQALLRKAVRRISLFTYEPFWVGCAAVPASMVPDLVEWEVDNPAFDREKYSSEDTSFGFGDGGTAELLAGGGFQVFDVKKGHP